MCVEDGEVLGGGGEGGASRMLGVESGLRRGFHVRSFGTFRLDAVTP